MAWQLTAVLVTPPTAEIQEVLGIAGRALQGGIAAIVVRRPQGSAREVFEITRQLRPATRREGCLLLVSDRVDVALAAGTDGVHLGRRSLPTAATRRILSTGMVLGRSVHGIEDAMIAEEEGADYVFLGPVFETNSHPDELPLGLETFAGIVRRLQVPVVAIGGVEETRLDDLVRSGARGAAAISAFYDVEDAAEVARAFRTAFG